MHLCSRRHQRRLPADPLSGPLHGLRTSRYRGACASAPHQGRSESHRHRNQVLKLASISALSFGTNPPDFLQSWFLVNESHLRFFVRQPVDPFGGRALQEAKSVRHLLVTARSKSLSGILHECLPRAYLSQRRQCYWKAGSTYSRSCSFFL